MSKKDYIRLAGALLETRPDATASLRAQWTLVRDAIIRELQDDNPRFDREKFLAWCHRGDSVAA